MVPAICLAVALPATATANTSGSEKLYYLALGDSLSVGVQPKANGANKNTRQGYAHQIARRAGHKLVNLGCGGATTASLIRGDKACSPKRKTIYRNKSAKTSQLAEAERFLRDNRGRVAFVTIDIGANDVASCAAGTGVDIECVNKGIAQIRRNGPAIAKRLRRAAGKKVPLAVMDLYNPFLQRWLVDDGGKTIAELSVDLARGQVNKELVAAFRPRRFRIARVAKAFDTYVPFERTTTYRGQAGVPLAVARICRLTWMCDTAPRGPNIHPRKAGYTEIAGAFRKVLGKVAR